MKRFSALLTALCIIITLCGCAEKPDDSRISVVCSTFSAFDWTNRIAGEGNDRIDIKLIPDGGTDMHSYQATVGDIVSIASCDILIYTGGQSEKWMEDAASQNPGAEIINMLKVLGDGAKPLEHISHDHDHDHDRGHDHNEELDEHVWLSLRNAKLFCSCIAEALALADPDNAESYRGNAESYAAELSSLDDEYFAAASSAKKSALVFADRFPFRYLTEDYGIESFAAFDGCSAETEASFETVIFLAKKTDELGLDSLIVIDGSTPDLARTVAENTQSREKRILTLDSMQSRGIRDIANGKSYLSVMRENLDVIKSALNPGE